MNGYEPGIRRNWPSVLALASALALWVAYEPGVRAVLRTVFPTADTLLYDRTPMWRFLGEHLGLVAAGGAISVGLGVTAGLVLVSPIGRPFRGVVMKLAGFGQAVPSVALMAMAVPAVGYGSTPVLIALVVFSVLPVMVNVIVGIEGVPAEVIEAGRGIGMSRVERLWQLEVPLALPVIMAGVRTMLVILVSAATLGAVVGAGGLGVPIMSGIGSFNNAVVAHGAVPAILLALIIDRTL
ncbi:MAG TPA: ABC transporter permease [Coriobacteriia bacterium]|nr:ABC transporter permease [Coriobacteriia bacterium]